jgi:hypothetical protein
MMRLARLWRLRRLLRRVRAQRTRYDRALRDVENYLSGLPEGNPLREAWEQSE